MFIPDSMERRGRRFIPFNMGTYFSVDSVIAVLKKLPEDAIFLGVDLHYYKDVNVLVFASDEWDPTPEGETVPYLYVQVTDVDIYNARGSSLPSMPVQTAPSNNIKQNTAMNSNACICDFEYTGLRYHKLTCPKK